MIKSALSSHTGGFFVALRSSRRPCDDRTIPGFPSPQLNIEVYKHDVNLFVSSLSERLVDSRKYFGALEFDTPNKHQALYPEAHLFGAFNLKRATEMDSATMRAELSASLTWNAAYKRFEVSPRT